MTIETERLLLRPFTEADAEDVFEYLHEPAVNCFACMKLESLEAARKELKQRQGDELYLAITLKENGKVIGEIFAHPEGNDPEDKEMDTFSPCWMLNLNYTGKGYAYEAAHAYFDYLFREKVRDASTPTLRITIYPASGFAKSSVCAGKDCSWNLSPSSIIQTAHRVMRTRWSMRY